MNEIIEAKIISVKPSKRRLLETKWDYLSALMVFLSICAIIKFLLT